jgi:hypothetical protein
MLREPEERVGVDVRAGPTGDVVDDDRQAAVVRDRLEVRSEHPGIRAVVVRRHDERRIGTQLGGPSGRRDRRAGVVGAGAGDDRDARPARAGRADDLDGQRDEALTLLGRQGRGLAGGPDGHEPVDAGQDLPRDEAPELGLVELAIGGERGDERGERAAKPRALGGREDGHR